MGELYNPYPRLPKNIRQTGDRDPIVKVYMEDYVHTYLKRLKPGVGQEVRVGLLVGNTEVHDGTPYIFLDGALEMEELTAGEDQVTFSEASWKKAYETMEQMFPKRTVQGWFICGNPESPLSPINYWHPHNQYFPGKFQLMYLNCGLEGEESIYITSEDGFYKLRGYCIYYERNPMMQDYMVLRKDAQRVESGIQDGVIRDFRERMADRKGEVNYHRSQLTVLKAFCMALSILVLAGGIVTINNYSRMKQMESVIASVLPEELAAGVEHLPGNVYPTESASVPEDSENALPGGAQTAEEQNIAAPDGSQGGAGGTGLQAADGQAAAPQETAGGEPAQAGAAAEADGAGAAGGDVTGGQPAGDDAAGGRAAANISAGGGGSAEPGAQAQPEPAEEAVRTETWENHTIQDGETLYGICFERYGNVDRLEEILKGNHLENPDNIISGQNLLLP